MVLSVIKQTILTFFPEILYLEGHPNYCIGSKVTTILLNRLILPIGGASSGRVCVCSLHSRLVYPVSALFVEQTCVCYPDTFGERI